MADRPNGAVADQSATNARVWAADSKMGSATGETKPIHGVALGTPWGVRRELPPPVGGRAMMVSGLGVWGFVLLCFADASGYGGVGRMWENSQGRTLFTIHAAGVLLYLGIVIG